jgi:pyridoxine kinase
MNKNASIVNHNRQKKVAVINDFSSFGRCSLAAALPIFSALKVQCCPVPTAVFTNHTGFEYFSWYDCSDKLDNYIADWKATGLEFSAIASGYLSSMLQLDFVEQFIKAFKKDATLIVVDPVMGDYGRLYPTFKDDVAKGLRRLLSFADILTPNLTEASILAGRKYDENLSDGELLALAEELCEKNARGCVISGVPRADHLANFVFSKSDGPSVVTAPRIGRDRSGTGDVFSCVVTGELLRGKSLTQAVEKAAEFVTATIQRAVDMEIPLTDGLPFEETLSMLWS